jgi:uncharacterized surface protein with fasciclin (FAS1) repeats
MTSLNMADTALSDIVDTAVAAGSFSTLAAALGAAGLSTLREGDPSLSLHTDEAFAKLLKELLLTC